MDTDSGYLKLDQEFDRYLAEMKPHVLKLPHKTGTNIYLTTYYYNIVTYYVKMSGFTRVPLVPEIMHGLTL